MLSNQQNIINEIFAIISKLEQYTLLIDEGILNHDLRDNINPYITTILNSYMAHFRGDISELKVYCLN